MKQTLILTPDTAYGAFEQGHLGFLVPKGLLMLNVPNDPESCVLKSRMHETLWQGHAESPEAIKLMEQTQAFALIERHGLDNPYGDIDFSEWDGSFTVPAKYRDFDSYPQEAQERAEEEVIAFLEGRIGYRVSNGILKVLEADDPDSCVLEVFGRVMWAGNAFDDEAYAMMEKSDGIINLTLPQSVEPLQA